VVETDSVSCLMAGFDINGAKPSASVITVLVQLLAAEICSAVGLTDIAT
jgi:hypothetical protein